MSELQSYLTTIMKTIQEINSWTDISDWREISNQYADIYWFRKKPLRDMLGYDWRVPESVRENIAIGNINEKMSGRLTDEQMHRLIYTII